MTRVSFQIIDGVDKGRVYLNVETPVTIGREEGNVVRLNDERVSRFHAKVREDRGQVVIMDLDSTNGTTVNGDPIQLRILRPGDRVGMGRSTLLFGTAEEIAAAIRGSIAGEPDSSAATVVGDVDANRSPTEAPSPPVATVPRGAMPVLDVFRRDPPRLPSGLSPAQAAQLSEVIDFLHRALADATTAVHVPPEAREAVLPFADWQKVQAVLGFLARYSREVAEPDHDHSSQTTIG